MVEYKLIKKMKVKQIMPLAGFIFIVLSEEGKIYRVRNVSAEEGRYIAEEINLNEALKNGKNNTIKKSKRK